MVETSSGVNSALSRALQQSKDQLMQQQDFATAVNTFQQQLLRDLRSSDVEAQSYLGKLLKSMDSAAQTLIGKMTSSVAELATGIAALSQVSRIRTEFHDTALTGPRTSTDPTTKLLTWKRILEKSSNGLWREAQSLLQAKPAIGKSVVA